MFFGWRDGGSYHQQIADEPTLIYYGYPQWNPLTDVTPEVTPKSPIIIPEPNPESVSRPVPDNAVSAVVPVIHQNLVMRYLM